MNQKELLAHIETTFAQCLEICRKKNGDYATDQDALKNLRASEVIGVDPQKAILVRLTDKFTRLGNLIDRPPQVKDESVEDTIRDIINYNALLLALRNAK